MDIAACTKAEPPQNQASHSVLCPDTKDEKRILTKARAREHGNRGRARGRSYYTQEGR